MDFLKILFENGAITWKQFLQGVNDKGLKIADLSTGNYVSKKKYDDDIQARDDQIGILNENINTRDADLADLKSQLESAGNDKVALDDITGKFDTLQTQYNNAKEEYEGKLKQQKYEFAVKEFANSQTFSSGAAKREFIRSMTEKGLQMENDSILGAADFLEAYKTENEDSFKIETLDKLPKFTDKSGGGDPNNVSDPFLSGFGN